MVKERETFVSRCYQMGNLTVDGVTHKVKHERKAVDLTSKEYQLLEFLLHHAGEVVTRTMILEHVWDIHFDNGTNVIDVYVNYLRNKLKEVVGNDLIKTIRGRGYLLQA